MKLTFPPLTIVSLLLAPSAFATSEATLAINKQTHQCLSECAEIVKFASGWHVVTKNANGDIAKVMPIDLPKSAKKRPFDANDGYVGWASDSGLSATAATYETANNILVVYITEYRAANGNLIDAQVNTVKMPKKTIVRR
ncbi:hypothetical protein [Shewanella sp. YIC-542]|uniref:hypothetical protein n=1 Tax=Shewanella mytili TaxID=3377111 RepID=UPI00398F7ACA